ncbi:hypothetical protein HQ325_18160 [Rhodococcus sp. BP-349]|jgi:hypothetical protein|uniref:hypothetical protein n=1 Tax=unclassified Rhodococcus (in: high G+C Gram-positive bacteria) TaxID=192944 RepID=UPI00070232F2|nr:MULTISPECIES: hypothetical protein [unclassified Rhodococcus (in: high G+C Gram-positive bacteria)]KQU02535.1 hypothetical protein ASG56_16410 [Rhodococcus sp. Leaf7]KQU38006.1 hypothetical protein ASG64_19140 [Rhodococcus sp. Leaf247]MBY6540600.1 hypothetical protein [Rhodococcus sp. BP-363]MBY6545375.1 hypothetical protein [Rhodococcus sp. BP-369]MBY6564605.1 hypothetical protein [Rhodococcus sp. BP-370]
MSEDDIVRALQDRARLALGQFADVSVGDDGSLGFSYAGALCSLRAVALSPGLEVLSLTAVLAWDRPSSGTLRGKVAVRNSESQFGSISLTTHGSQADVVMRYTFPASGLDDEPLMTMLVLVLSGVEKARVGLVP